MTPLTRDQIAARIALEVQDGFVVNLGIGIPTLVVNHIEVGMIRNRERIRYSVSQCILDQNCPRSQTLMGDSVLLESQTAFRNLADEVVDFLRLVWLSR